MMMIEISESKFDKLSEYTEKMLKYGGKIMSCLSELEEESGMGHRGGYGMRGGQGGGSYGGRYGQGGGSMGNRYNERGGQGGSMNYRDDEEWGDWDEEDDDEMMMGQRRGRRRRDSRGRYR